MITPYKRHKYTTLSMVVSLFVYALFAVFLKYSPFPFFDWELFSAAPQISTIYEIRITALRENEKLSHSIPLSKLSPELHRNWNPSPFNLVQRWGWLLDESAWKNQLPLAERHMRDYFTSGIRIFSGQRSEHDMLLYQKLVENYFRYLPHVEFDVVKIKYSTATYWHDHKPVSLEIIASFKKSSEKQ